MSSRNNNDGNNRGGVESELRKNSTARQHHLSKQQQRKIMELDIIQGFDRVLVTQLSSIRAQDMGEPEKDFALKFFRSLGVIEGLAAGALAFYGLNRFPRHYARYVTRKRQRSQGYMLDKANLTPKKPTSPFQSPDEQEIKKEVSRKRNKFLFSSLELFFDLGMSFGVGMSVAFLTADKGKAMKTATDVPLQPGRSLLSDQCCPSLLAEYKRQWKKESKDNHTNGISGLTTVHQTEISRSDLLRRPEHPTLQFILKMTENCRHRQVMEQDIRSKELLSTSTPIAIPSIGVIPQTEDPLLELLLEEGDETNNLHAWSPDRVEDLTSEKTEE